MILVIDAALSEPPSSVHCFRDVSLYANVFKSLDVLTACPKQTKDIYWHWLKKHGAMDFKKDILHYNEEKRGIHIKEKSNSKQVCTRYKYSPGITIPKLDEIYLQNVIRYLNGL